MKANIQIGDQNSSYTVYQTTAPRAYDYSGVIELMALSQGERIVMVPERIAAGQVRRYGSSLSEVKAVAGDDSAMAKMLFRRLARRLEARNNVLNAGGD